MKPDSDGQRRAQFVAGVGDEIGAHLLDPAERRLVVERHQHALLGAAEQRRYRHRGDDELHPAIDRHLVEIGRPARLAGRDRLAQRGDDFGRPQCKLRQLVLAQRGRKLGDGGVEMNDAAGAIEQHRRIRHAGHHGADGRGLDWIDGADVFTGGDRIVQPPRHQGRGCDADEHRDSECQREIGRYHQRAKRKPRGDQDDRRMPQPVRPRGEEGGRTGIVYCHRAGFFPRFNGCALATLEHLGASRRQAPVSPRSRT